MRRSLEGLKIPLFVRGFGFRVWGEVFGCKVLGRPDYDHVQNTCASDTIANLSEGSDGRGLLVSGQLTVDTNQT